MDSVSVATSFKDKLAELGVIFCSLSEVIQEHRAGEEIHRYSSSPEG